METKYELKKPERSIKMGCGNEISDWDDRAVQDSLAGKNTGFDPKMLAEVMPEVERAIEERCVECLHENIEDGKRGLLEILSQSSSAESETALTDIKKLDLGVEPTDAEYGAMLEVGKELGMVKNVEIIDMPVVTGVKGDETVQVVDKELQEMGYNKPVEKFTHLDIETTKALTRETLGFLVESKIPEEWRDQATVNMIVGVDKQQPGSEPGKIAVEQAVKPEELQKTDHKTLERSRNLYLFQNSEGRLVPRDPKDAKNEEERKAFEKEKADFQWKIAHGICHINDPRFKDERVGRFDTRIAENPSEWIKACEAQLKAGVVDKEPGSEEPPYSLSEFKPEVRNNSEIVQDGREFRAQHFAAWVTNSTWVPGSPPLCPEMKEFFDKYFLE